MKKNKNIHYKRFIAALLIIVVPVLSTNFVRAISNKQIATRQNVLEAKIKENEAQVEVLSNQVSTLKTALKALDLQIAKLKNEIKLNELNLLAVKTKLKQTRFDLERQKQILREALRESYISGDVRTIELVVSSENFSDFFDQQEYLDRIRSTIQDSAHQVAQLEIQLEAQELEQTTLLDRLTGQKALLDTRREEKSELLAETRGQQAVYARKVKADKKEYQRLQNILAARQKVVALGSGNYPYAATPCEAPYDQEYPPPEVPDTVYPCPGDGWGYIIRQCTSWAYWRRRDMGKKAGHYWGDASEWKNRAEKDGYRVSQKPRKGAIGVVYVGKKPQNHVYIVEDILDNGDIIASQYNSFAANKAWGMYSLVEKTPEQYAEDWFIRSPAP